MSWKKIPTMQFILAALLFATVALFSAQPVQAQFFDNALEQDDLFVEDEDQFFEPKGDDLGSPEKERDFTEGDKFVDESVTPAERGTGITEGGRRYQLNLQDDRHDLPLNMAWGAGTGLLLGGWYALINEGDNRSTQRAIGMGIVMGLVLGTLIGTRAVFNPNAARATGQVTPPAKDSAGFTPLVFHTGRRTTLGFRMHF